MILRALTIFSCFAPIDRQGTTFAALHSGEYRSDLLVFVDDNPVSAASSDDVTQVAKMRLQLIQ
jgi:hypothetical protein